MCGIVGVLNFNNKPIDLNEILLMNEKISHRGKDSFKVVVGSQEDNIFSNYPGVALGHRRLSIIDLSDNASQPMSNSDHSVWLVYNGELFNYLDIRKSLQSLGYSFRTNSDTEVILMSYLEWGESMLDYFNGMFAFAIWDDRSKKLFCGRDINGIKPFYYSIKDGAFKFSSESQALIDFNCRELNIDAVHSFFYCMYVPSQLSIFEGVNKLLPGHSMTVDVNGSIQVKKYFNLNVKRNVHIKSVVDAADYLNPFIDKAIKRQLLSDVPIGAFLSGGFDSGLIVAKSAQHINKLHTYSVGFDMGNVISELGIAKRVAQKYSTIHNERIIASNEIMPYLDLALSKMSEPVSDSSIIPTYCLSEMASSDGIKVLLSGTGGDEIFAGYERYTGYSIGRELFLNTPSFLKEIVSYFPGIKPEFKSRLNHVSMDMILSQGGNPQLLKQILDDKIKYNDFLKKLTNSILPKSLSKNSLLFQQMQFDIEVYLPDLLLLILDQLTMAHTIEGRVPYLDIELIKASLSIPSEFHSDGKISRKVQRVIAKGKIDDLTFKTVKQGFSGPVLSWVKMFFPQFRDRVMDLRGLELFSSLNIESYFSKSPTSLSYRECYDIFSLYCFSVWYDKHVRNK
jgi:asparagine synthase (glutamine-hydrolysing)